MMNKLLTLALGIFLCGICELSAQTPINKPLKSVHSTKEVKTDARNSPVATRNLNKSNYYSAASFVEEAANEDLEVQYVAGYKINFPANIDGEADTPLTSINIYAAQNKHIATLFFLDGSSELIAEPVVFEDEKMQLYYNIDLFPNMMDFLRYVSKIIVVYNTETKAAYLSSAVNMSKGR